MPLSPESQRLIDRARAKAREWNKPRATVEEMTIVDILRGLADRLEAVEHHAILLDSLNRPETPRNAKTP